jgi:hypothetical protein
LAVLLLLAASGGVLSVAYYGAEARAINRVKQLGGRVRFDEDQRRGGHVVAIELGVARLNDEGLASITPLWWTFPQLRILDLRGSGVSDAGVSHLAGAKLQNLLLDDTRITSEGLRFLGNSSELRSLSLNGTQISDDGLAYLAGLTHLGNLHLHGTPITDDGLQRLEAIASLRYLELGENRGVTDAGVERLQRALPELRVSK